MLSSPRSACTPCCFHCLGLAPSGAQHSHGGGHGTGRGTGERLDLRARSAQDRADAIPTGEFRVSQVSDDFTNRPFPRRRTLTPFRRRDAFDQTFKLSWAVDMAVKTGTESNFSVPDSVTGYERRNLRLSL